MGSFQRSAASSAKALEKTFRWPQLLSLPVVQLLQAFRERNSVCFIVLARMVTRSSSSNMKEVVVVLLVSLVLVEVEVEGAPALDRDLLTHLHQVCQFQVDKDGGYHKKMCRRAENCGQMALVPPSEGSVSLETWLVQKEERVELCQRLEYAASIKGSDPSNGAAIFFPPSSSSHLHTFTSAHLHSQPSPSSAHLHSPPSSVLPLFPLSSSSSTIPQDVDGEEFVFPDSPIQPLGMYDYDQDEPLQSLDYAESVPEEEEREKGEEGVGKDGDDGSEDVNKDLEENFEMSSVEDLFEAEDRDNSAVEDSKKAGDEKRRDLEEMFATAENSIEKADNDSREDVTNGTTTDLSEELGVENDEDGEEDDEEDGVEDAEPSQGDVGGTAIFDSIDLVRQAVEFLTVSK